MSEFNERPLVVGAIAGIRSFKVDNLGRLTGIAHKAVWKPGLNTAKCNCTVGGYVSAGSFSIMQPSPAMYGTKMNHTPGEHGAKCGYWAFFDGSRKFHEEGQIEAIVEGSGRVTVGSRGFRSEKAKVVALIDPTPPPLTKKQNNKNIRYNFLLKHFTILDRAALVLFVTGIFLASLAFGYGVVEGRSIYAFAAFLAGVILSASALSFSSFTPNPKYAAPKRVNANGPPKPSPKFVAVCRNYPDIPVYANMDDALKDFDVFPPAEAEPLTPENDQTFWERAQSPSPIWS